MKVPGVGWGNWKKMENFCLSTHHPSIPHGGSVAVTSLWLSVSNAYQPPLLPSPQIHQCPQQTYLYSIYSGLYRMLCYAFYPSLDPWSHSQRAECVNKSKSYLTFPGCTINCLKDISSLSLHLPIVVNAVSTRLLLQVFPFRLHFALFFFTLSCFTLIG